MFVLYEIQTSTVQVKALLSVAHCQSLTVSAQVCVGKVVCVIVVCNSDVLISVDCFRTRGLRLERMWLPLCTCGAL